MNQRDLIPPARALECCDAFDAFMKRKPKKLRNLYWRAFVHAWKLAEGNRP